MTAFQEECSKDLAAAEPIIKEAEAALNSLDKASLGELKSFGSPAAEVVQVLSACMVLTASGGKIPKVRFPSNKPPLTSHMFRIVIKPLKPKAQFYSQDLSWNAGKKFMGNVDAFLKSLQAFDKDNIPIICVDKVIKIF